jgi:hypothetical protein
LRAPESTRRALDQAQEAAATYRIGQTVYITNAVPYFDALTKGHSRQAPPNFHVEAVHRGAAVARKARLLAG